jgi:hypothetical protein
MEEVKNMAETPANQEDVKRTYYDKFPEELYSDIANDVANLIVEYVMVDDFPDNPIVKDSKENDRFFILIEESVCEILKDKYPTLKHK